MPFHLTDSLVAYSFLFNAEHDQCDDHNDNEQDHRLSCRASEPIVKKGVAVNGIHNNVGSFIRASLCQDLNLSEGLKCLDNIYYQCIEHNGRKSRQCQTEKLLHTAGSVYGSSLIDGLVNVSKTC